MATHSTCQDHVPNDWAAYVHYQTGELLHVDRFYNPECAERRRQPPPGGWYPDDLVPEPVA